MDYTHIHIMFVCLLTHFCLYVCICTYVSTYNREGQYTQVWLEFHCDSQLDMEVNIFVLTSKMSIHAHMYICIYACICNTCYIV